MTFAVIVVDEFLQFGCWSPVPGSGEHQCEGFNGFFSAFRITDVKLESGNSFFLDPTLIFPASDKSPDNADPQLFPNPEHFAAILLDPSKGFTFQGSGQGPMLIVRDVFLPGEARPAAGEPTQLSYISSPGDEVVFEAIGSVPIPTVEVADPSMVP